MADDVDRSPERQQGNGDGSQGQFTPASLNRERQDEFQRQPSKGNQYYGNEDIEALKKLVLEFWGWFRLQNVDLHKWITLGVEILAFCGLVYYAFVTKQMWHEMQTQTTIQRNTGINSERA